MSEIKLIIDGTEYDVYKCGKSINGDATPLISFKESMYEGMAISKKVKPDYEILSIFKGDSFCCDKIYFKWYLEQGWQIGQVKRLPDGEIFCVDLGASYGKDGIIKKFTISPVGEMLCDIKFDESSGFSNAPLRAIEKVKPKHLLYKTEEGTPVNVDDKFLVYYTKEANNNWEIASCYACNANLTYKVFGERKNLDDYILNNKPVENLTLKELDQCFEVNGNVCAGYQAEVLRKIKELFKSKM